MASSQALGAGLAAYNPLISPDIQTKLLQAQQQQAMAQALLSEGMSPIDISNRQIGGVAYKVSPLEGVAKIAQQLSGRYQQQEANQDLMKAFNAPAQQTDANGNALPSNGAGGGVGLSASGQQILAGMSPGNQQLLAGLYSTNPDAFARIYAALAAPTPEMKNYQAAFGPAGNQVMAQKFTNDANPGAVSYNQELGKSAAGNAPVGSMPQGMNPMMPNLVQAESGGNNNAVSPAGAQGIAQIMPNTARDPGYGVQPLQGWDGKNPATAPILEQLRFSNDYLNAMQAHNGGNPQLAAAAYNAGPGAVDNAGIGSSGPVQTISRLPAETQAYVPKVAGAMPAPIPGESINQYNARLEANKEGTKAEAEAKGKALGEAEKGVATIDSRFDNSQAILDEMARLAPQTSGGPAAVVMEPFHRMMNDKTSAANKSFENLASNQLTTALAPIVQGVGGRIDIPLMRAIQEAESVDLTDSNKGKLQVINNLKNMLAVQKQNAHNQVASMQGQPLSSQPSAFQPPQGWSIRKVQ